MNNYEKLLYKSNRQKHQLKVLQDKCHKYKKEINKLTAESTEWEGRTYCWQDRAENLQIVLDKIKEYVKNNEKCIVECSGRDFMTGIPYEKIKTGLIEKARIEKLLEEIE